MAPGGGAEPPPPLPPELTTFKKLVAACNKRSSTTSQQKFVKKMEAIPMVALPAEENWHAALNLVERGLIGHFTCLWPPPRSIELWVH